MSTLDKTRYRLWEHNDPRNLRPDVVGPCVDSVGSIPPNGSGVNPYRNHLIGQTATHTTVATLFTNQNNVIAPWSYVGPFSSDGRGSEDLLSRCQRVGEHGFNGAPPQTYVVSLASREVTGPQNEINSVFPTTNTAAIMSAGRRYTRLQAVIEVGTGTGTQLVFPVDISAGTVFRVFGTGARVWVLKYPSSNLDLTEQPLLDNPYSVPVSESSGFPVPGGRIPAVTVVQASIQGNWRPQEGFPGSWQLTGTIYPLAGLNVIRVPPFARSVKISQAPGGAVIPAYRVNDINGSAIATINVPPGSRTSELELQPGLAYTIENTTTVAVTSPAQVVFNVSQF